MFPQALTIFVKKIQKRASSLIKEHLNKIHPSVKQILLLSEEHTRNFYYWDNVFVIKSLIEKAGRKVVVCVPGKHIETSQKIVTAAGREVFVQLLSEVEGI